MTALLLRQATPTDAPALATLAQQVFTATYGAQIPAAILARYLATTLSVPALRAKLTAATTACWLAWRQQQLIGFSKLSAHPPPTGLAPADALELVKLYVDHAYHGQGVAGRLLAETLATAAHLDCQWLWLCVWQENARAIAFYRKAGFTVVGEQAVWVESIRFDDWVMVRTV